jgi:flagellar assembly factor FliW
MSSLAETIPQDVLIQSKLLGPLEVMQTQIYTFPEDIYGFPGARDFALLPTERTGFFWLQSVDFEALTFLLIDPFLFVEGYSVDVGPDELGALEPEDASELMVLTILTLPREQGDAATVNLQGPIVLNVVERLAKQVVIESPYGIRCPVDLTRVAA